MRWMDTITDSMDTNFSKLQEIVADRGGWRASVHEIVEWEMTGATEQQEVRKGNTVKESNTVAHLRTTLASKFYL